nr:glycosyltransferase [Anaerotignum lactatifermentans]
MKKRSGPPEDDLLPFLAELKEEIYFRGCVEPWKERWVSYYQEEFAAHHANGRPWREGDPPVTVFVPACGHLEATKNCVESILRHTPQADYDLLLIDHGSRDDTRVYFQRVPGARVMAMKENVRMLMFSSAFRACRGKYLAFVSNDTEVTEGWLERLTDCLETLPKAVSATPVTPATSNFQSQEAVSLAEGRFCWRRRSRIMPVIGVYDREKVNEIGFADRLFWSMEFWDDDFSLRARRRGFWQMLCTNVYCHHLGSLTGRAAWEKEHTLAWGRELFWKKHGTDPWAKGFCRQEDLMVLVRQWRPSWSKAEGLAIDCGFGDGPLEIGNHCALGGAELFWQAVTTEAEFLPDLAAYAEKGEAVTDLEPWLKKCFAKKRFQVILREEMTEEGLMPLLARGLERDGILWTMGRTEKCPGLERLGQCGLWQTWRKKGT